MTPDRVRTLLNLFARACVYGSDDDRIKAGKELEALFSAPAAQPVKAERVHTIVNASHFPGMSEAFDAHMGAACWTDPAYAPDASMWAAAWKAAKAQSQSVAVPQSFALVPVAHRYTLELPDGDGRAARVVWSDRSQSGGAITHALCIAVKDTATASMPQWRKVGTAPWWDGHPDESDGDGPYETRVLSAPALMPLTDEQIDKTAYALWMSDNYLPVRTFARAIERAHNIGTTP